MASALIAFHMAMPASPSNSATVVWPVNQRRTVPLSSSAKQIRLVLIFRLPIWTKAIESSVSPPKWPHRTQIGAICAENPDPATSVEPHGSTTTKPLLHMMSESLDDVRLNAGSH